MGNFDHVLTVLGGIVTLCSSLASFVNHIVRSRQTAGEPVAPALLGAGSLLNLGAVNVDKAIQLAKILRGLPVPQTGQAAPTDGTQS